MAQTFGQTAVISFSNETPSPNELVVAKVRSSSYENLLRSTIIWSVDGVEKKRGIGEVSFQFQAPKNGQSSTISVLIQKEDGYSYSGQRTIRPGSLDLIYEANTYTPPFYKGRSLFTHESVVTVAAITDFIENGVKVPKEKLVYIWEIDGQVLQNSSGGGKDSLRIQGSLLQEPFRVSVTVESLNSELRAKKTILINQINPNVVLYENNPIYGSIFEKALTGTFNMDREEVSFTAVPYFFSASNRSDADLRYSWYENSRKIGDETFSSFINYINPNREKSGASKIKVEVDHTEHIFQDSSVEFKINVLGNEQSDTIEQNESTAF